MVLAKNWSGSYAGVDSEDWPALSLTEHRAMHDIAERRVAVVWLKHEGKFASLGYKPWFAITCSVRPHTLHHLWLHRLVRLDRGSGVYDLDGGERCVGRARLTPLGRRVLEANR